MAEVLEFIIKGKDEFTGVMGRLLGQLGTFGKYAGLAVGALAGVGTGVLLMTKRVADAHDELGKFAKMIGVSTESLSGLRFAAELSNVDISTFNTSLRFMARNLSEAAQNGGPAVKALRDLGLSASQLAGMSADEQLLTIAKSMEGLSSQSDKVRMSFELFGRGGVQMLNMLGEGAEKIQRMTKEAEKFGIVVSAQAAANADEFGDSLTRMNAALEGVRNAFVEKIMPVLTGFFNSLANWIATHRKEIVKFAETSLLALSKVVEYGVYGAALLVDAWRGLKMLWSLLKLTWFEMAASIQKGLAWIVDGMIAVIALDPKLKFMFGGTLDSLQKFSDNTKSIIRELEASADEAGREMAAVANEGMAVEKVQTWIKEIKDAIDHLKRMGTAAVEVKEQVSDASAQLAASLHEIWTKWLGESAEALQDFSMEFQKITATLWQTFTKGVGDAFAQMIVYGKKLSTAFKELGQQLLATMISMLVQLGLRYIALQILKFALGIQEAGSRMAIIAAETYGSAFASTAAIPIIGPALAPGVAAASTAIMLAGAAAAGTMGSAAGMTIAGGGGAAHAGLTEVPRDETWFLKAGERIVAPEQNRDLTEFLAAQGGAGGGSIHIGKIEVVNPFYKSNWAEVMEKEFIPALNRAVKRKVYVEGIS